MKRQRKIFKFIIEESDGDTLTVIQKCTYHMVGSWVDYFISQGDKVVGIEILNELPQ